MILALFLGVLTWSLLEYLIHRFLGHEPRTRPNPFAAEHIRHHSEGDYFAPTWKKVLAAALLTAVLSMSDPDLMVPVFKRVIDNGRIAALPEIAAQFRALKNAQLGSFDAVVYSAFEVDSASLADLSGVLEKRFGRKLNLHVELQPDLIGGIRVVVGDEVLDTSVKARLEQMKIALTA